MCDRTFLMSLLHFDKNEGVFYWTQDRMWKCKAGSKAGHLHKSGYVRIIVDGKSYLAHRLAWLFEYGEWPSDQIDHVNRNRSDNRICNLRLADHTINQHNRTDQSNKTGFRGVTTRPGVVNKPFMAQIQYRKKHIYIGVYDTAEEAHAAYLKKREEVLKDLDVSAGE